MYSIAPSAGSGGSTFDSSVVVTHDRNSFDSPSRPSVSNPVLHPRPEFGFAQPVLRALSDVLSRGAW
jgi:hypothetical protein